MLYGQVERVSDWSLWLISPTGNVLGPGKIRLYMLNIRITRHMLLMYIGSVCDIGIIDEFI